MDNIETKGEVVTETVACKFGNNNCYKCPYADLCDVYLEIANSVPHVKIWKDADGNFNNIVFTKF